MAKKKSKKSKLDSAIGFLMDSENDPKKKIKLFKLALLGSLIVGLLGFSFQFVYAYGTQFERTITIKERPNLGVEYDKRVEDTEGNWYAVTDALPFLKFRSMDTWGNLEVGHTYKVKGFGWRIGFFSAFPNIYEIKETIN